MTNIEYITCVICKMRVEAEYKGQKTCLDRICRERLKHMNDTRRYRERAESKRISDAEVILASKGYLIIPPIDKYRVILEPVKDE